MKRYRIILVLLLFFYIVITSVAISKDNSLWWEDSSFYYRKSLRYYDELSHLNLKTPLNLYRIDRARHSIFMYFSVPFYFIFGTQHSAALYPNLLFLIILMLSTYGIGKYLRDRKTGLLSAALVMLFPAISLFSRVYMLEFALTAVVALSIYLLLKIDQFKNSIYSLLFGITFAMGMLIKLPYIVFVIIPFIYIMYISLTKDELAIRTIIRRNIIITSLLGIGIPLIWYLPGINHVINRIIFYAIDFGFLVQDPYRKHLFIYLFINRLISLFFFIIFILSLYYYIKTPTTHKSLILSWIGFPLIFFTFVPHKHPTYILSILPAISLIISIGVLSVRKSWVKQLIITTILSVGSLQYYVLTYNPFLFHSKDKPLLNRLVKFMTVGNILHQPVDTRDWGIYIRNIIKTVKDHCDITKEKQKIDIMVLSMHEYVWSLQNDSYILRLPFSFIPSGYKPLKSLDIDFVLTQDGGSLTCDENFFLASQQKVLNNINRSRAFFERNIDKFKLIKVLVLPNDARVSIYKKL